MMDNQFSGEFEYDFGNFLQERLHVAYGNISRSKASQNLEKAEEKAEKELKEALGEEGWKAYRKWYLDHENIYNLEDSLAHNEIYLQGFQDGQIFANRLSRSELFFTDNYEDIEEIVENDKRRHRIGKKLTEEAL